MNEYANDVLVSTDWVADASTGRPRPNRRGRRGPGAVRSRRTSPARSASTGRTTCRIQARRDFLGPEEFGELMGSRGISNQHTVVLYGDRNNWFAAYTYWYFRYHGHEAVKLMNGRARSGSARAASAADLPAYPRAEFSSASRTLHPRARAEVEAVLELRRSLVDVRSPAEFAGEIISPQGYEQEGAQRAGHIPGAATVPWSKAVNEDGTFKSAEELRGSTPSGA